MTIYNSRRYRDVRRSRVPLTEVQYSMSEDIYIVFTEGSSTRATLEHDGVEIDGRS